MAEILVQAKGHWMDDMSQGEIDALPQSRKDNRDARIQLGDIVVVKPDGWEWGKEEKLPHYMLPRFIRLVEKMPMTDTMKIKKATLKHECFYRDPDLDSAEKDSIYEIRDGKPHIFTTEDYSKEIAKYSDPTNMDRLKTCTQRNYMI